MLFFYMEQNVVFENNVSHMALLSRNAGMQELAKRAHRVGQHLSRDFSNHSYYL